MREHSPDVRAGIIGDVLCIVAKTPDSVAYGTLFERVRSRTGLPEEEVGEAIMHATSILVLAGVLTSNRHDEALGEITYAADTRISAGARLLGYVWREDLPRAEPDDDGPVLRPR